jgi:BASS family bile acid:Na+ symporter
VRLDVLETIMQIFIIIVIPVSIGMLIRRYKESFALRMAKPVRTASGFVIALVIVGIFIKERDNFVSYFQQAGVVAIVLNITTMLIGYYTSRLFRIKDKAAVSISIESGIQNGTLAITIAVVLLGNSEFAIAPAIYSLLMFFTGGVAIYYGLRRDKAVAV